MQYTTLCLPKSKLTFKMKLRCSLFSLSVISFSDYRSVTPKSLYHFSVSQRLVCKLFPLEYNIAPVSLSGLISTNHFMHLILTHSDSLSDSQSCHVIFSFCTLYLFFLLPDMTCPFLSWKDSCISIKKHFQQYLLWKLPDLCQGKHCAPEYFESKYPKRCVVIFYLYVCLLYLM